MYGLELSPNVVMRDQDDAINRAVVACFPGVLQFSCFFHVKKNLRDKFKQSPKLMALASSLYSATSESSFDVILHEASLNVDTEDGITFPQMEYLFDKMQAPHGHWQLFRVPRGFSGTNNPLESFNRSLKGDYLNRRRVGAVSLLESLGLSIRTKFTADDHCLPVATVRVHPKILRRHKRQHRKLRHSERRSKDVVKDHDRKKYAVKLFEIHGKDACSCYEFMVYGACQHLTFALAKRGIAREGHVLPQALVTNRRRGRPRDNAAALERQVRE